MLRSNMPNPKSILLVLSALVACVLIGGLVALLPIGFFVRVSLPFLVLGILLTAWCIRNENNEGFPALIYAGLITLVILSVLWPRYIYFHFSGLPGVNPFTLLTMGMLLLILIQIVAAPAYSRRVSDVFWSGGLIGIFVLVWFAWRIFATTFGEYPLIQLIYLLREFIYISSFFFFAIALGSYPDGPRDVVRALVFSGLIASAIGLIEGFIQINPFVGFITLAGADIETATTLANIASEKVREGAFRAQSTFDHPIVFAQFVGALLPIALYCAANDKSKLWRLLGVITIPVALAAIATSGSRAGIVSVTVACAAVGFIWWLRAMLYGRVSKIVAIFSLPAFFMLILFFVYIISELAGGRSPHEVSSTNARLLMLNTGINALWDSPLVGFGNGMSVIKAGIQGAGGVWTIDVYFLTLALDYGYIGLLLFGFVVAWLGVRLLVHAVRNSGDSGAFAAAFLAGIIALIAAFAVLSIDQNMSLLWLFFGLGFAILGSKTNLACNNEGRL